VRDDAALMSFARASVQGDQAQVPGRLAGAPKLAQACFRVDDWPWRTRLG
jgi:hypothetical protein